MTNLHVNFKKKGMLEQIGNKPYFKFQISSEQAPKYIYQYPCDNPFCGCDRSVFKIYNALEDIESDRFECAFDVSCNSKFLKKNVFIEQSKERKKLVRKYLKVFQKNLTTEDWAITKILHTQQKERLIKEYNPAKIENPYLFHIMHGEDLTMMIPFHEIHPLAFSFPFTYQDTEYTISDIHCKIRACPCTDVAIELDHTDSIEFRYDYANSIIDTPKYQWVVDALKETYEDFDERLKERSNKVKRLFELHIEHIEALIRKKAKARKAKLLTSRSVGKNAPCSCGSGKKYKRCCGK